MQNQKGLHISKIGLIDQSFTLCLYFTDFTLSAYVEQKWQTSKSKLYPVSKTAQIH